MIKTENLEKVYRTEEVQTQALNRVSLTVEAQGEFRGHHGSLGLRQIDAAQPAGPAR